MGYNNSLHMLNPNNWSIYVDDEADYGPVGMADSTPWSSGGWNGSGPGSSMPDDDELSDDKITVAILFGFVIVLGVLGNSLVVYVMLKYAEKNATNCYMINLAFTDLTFVIIVVPFTIPHYIMPQWVFGVLLCKLTQYMIYVTLQATCLTLMAMTIDRYFAIVHPIKSMRQRTPQAAIVVSVVIWILSLAINVPFAIYNDLIPHEYHDGVRLYCRDNYPSVLAGQASIVYFVACSYVLPLLVIILCYIRIVRFLWNHSMKTSGNQPAASGNGSVRQDSSRTRSNKRRRRASKMISVVVFLFAAFWLPIHIFQLWIKFDVNFPRTNITYYYKIIAHALSYSNSVVNPFVYAFLSDGFRKGVRKAFPWIERFSKEGQPAVTDGHPEATSVALSNIRKFLPRRWSAAGTTRGNGVGAARGGPGAGERMANNLEASGVYVGVPTEEVFRKPPPLVPREPECSIAPEQHNKKRHSEVTYLESDI